MGRTVVRSEHDSGIVTLTLNRPERLNAMNFELVAELHAAIEAIESDRSCRVVVLTGAGSAFCAGFDLKNGAAVPGTESLGGTRAWLETQRHIASLVPHLRSLRQPIIAAVNGAACGGGFALALASDIRVAAASARFNAAFVKVGLSGCDIGVSWLLPRLVGASTAFELMLTGRFIGAAEAHQLGLVSRVVGDADVVDEGLKLAREIVQNSEFGIEMTKQVMWSQLEVGSLQAGIELENRTQILAMATGDFDAERHRFDGPP